MVGEDGSVGEVWKNLGEEEGNADYEGMVQPSQKHLAPCVKEVQCGLGTRGSLFNWRNQQFHVMLHEGIVSFMVSA